MKDFADFIKILIDRPWHFFCLGVMGLVILFSPRLEDFVGLKGCRAIVGATTVIALVWGGVCFTLHIVPKWRTWRGHRQVCSALKNINERQWDILDGFWRNRDRIYHDLYRDDSDVKDLAEKGILRWHRRLMYAAGDPTSSYEIPKELWEFLKRTRWEVAS